MVGYALVGEAYGPLFCRNEIPTNLNYGNLVQPKFEDNTIENEDTIDNSEDPIIIEADTSDVPVSNNMKGMIRKLIKKEMRRFSSCQSNNVENFTDLFDPNNNSTLISNLLLGLFVIYMLNKLFA